MNDQRKPSWFPSRRNIAFDWYLTRLIRLMGAAGFCWELAIDKGRNPLILLLSVQLAASLDVLQLVRGLLAQARMEKLSLDDLLQQEIQQEQHDS